MSKFALIAGLCLIGNLALAQGRYSYTLDLSQVENDELEINLVPPGSEEEEVEFHFPKIVPGTYSIYDFGRFVKSFKAYDKELDRKVAIKVLSLLSMSNEGLPPMFCCKRLLRQLLRNASPNGR